MSDINYERALAIDPGSHMGWAVVDLGKLTLHGNDRPTKAKGLPTMPYLNAISALIQEHTPDIVVSEGMLIVSNQTGGLAYAKSVILVEVAAALHGIDHDYVYPASWRAHYNMPVKKDKQASIMWANNLADQPIINDNEAEAILLGLYHFSVHGRKKPSQLDLLV